MDFLLLDAVLYSISLIIFIIYYKRVNAFIILWSMNTFVAILGYVSVKMQIYTIEDPNIGYKISIMPIIFNYVFTFILCSPFLSYRERSISLFPNFQQNKFANKLLIFISILVVFVFITKGIETLIMSQFDASVIYEQRRDGISYNVFGSYFFSKICNVCYGIYISTYSILILFAISMYAETHKRKYLALMVFALAPRLLGGISAASRGDMFFAIAEMSFFYLILNRYLSKKDRVFIYLTGLCIVAIFFIQSLTITEARFSGSSRKSRLTNTQSILKYFGESHVNFTYLIYDKVRDYPNGARLFNIGNEKKFSNINEERDYWDIKTKVPIRVFKTAGGDCYLEYGLIGALIFVIIFALLWKKIVFSKQHKYYITPLIYLYFHICFFGVFDFYFTYMAIQGLVILSFFCYLLKKTLVPTKN